MRHINIYMVIVVLAFSSFCTERAMAQEHGERKVVREGNKAFREQEYQKSLDLYNEALNIDSTCMEATYNRANAYHQVMLRGAGRDSTMSWEQSNRYYEKMLADKRMDDTQSAEVLRNVGESLMRQQEYEAALNAFRESLLLNPNDEEAKYNYVLAKRVVDEMRNQQNQNQNQQNQNQQDQQNQDQQNQQGGGSSNQDQNQDQQDQQGGGNNSQDENKDNQGEDNNQNGNGQQNPNQDDDSNEDGNGQQNPNQGDGDEQEGESPQNGESPAGLSDEQEDLLNAVQAQEDKTQDRLNNGKAYGRYQEKKKNW